MFGECHSESPRLPSPWLSRSSGGSPSPLSLPSPNGSSSPTTPTDTTTTKGFRARRRSSLEEQLDLLDGLANEFEDCHLDKGHNASADFVAAARTLLDEVTVAEIEQVAVLDARAAGLQPEVDHQGNIEYKLKIAMPTSIHRLEKLRTQLKWRLVEGGGTAIYELGLLDDGTLVGLNRGEMEQSLKTLAQMLAGLGGGRIQISRVIRIGREDNEAAAEVSSDDARARRPSLFPSFDVLADDDDISFVASGTPPVVDPITGETSIFPPPRIRGPTPYPVDRSNDQQAAFRRDKRDARRARRREAEYLVGSSTMTTPWSSRAASRSSLSSPSHASSLYSTRSSTPASLESQPGTPPIPIPPRSFQTSYPSAIEPRAKPLKPPKPPRATTARLRKSEGKASVAEPEPDSMPLSRPTPKKPRAAEPHSTPFKPVLPHECAEVRYVVEAIVRKAGTPADPFGGGRRRRKSSAGSGRSEENLPALRPRDASGEAATGCAGVAVSQSEEDELSDDDNDSLLSGDEGWNYLDFDLSAVAAAATAAHAAASSAPSKNS